MKVTENTLECRKQNKDTIINCENSVEHERHRNGHTNQKNSTKYTASIPEFNIKINRKTVDKSNVEYPLLTFRDITYFPLTWKYGVNEFGWDYYFDNKKGFAIKHQNVSPMLLVLGVFT